MLHPYNIVQSFFLNLYFILFFSQLALFLLHLFLKLNLSFFNLLSSQHELFLRVFNIIGKFIYLIRSILGLFSFIFQLSLNLFMIIPHLFVFIQNSNDFLLETRYLFIEIFNNHRMHILNFILNLLFDIFYGHF